MARKRATLEEYGLTPEQQHAVTRTTYARATDTAASTRAVEVLTTVVQEMAKALRQIEADAADGDYGNVRYLASAALRKAGL